MYLNMCQEFEFLYFMSYWILTNINVMVITDLCEKFKLVSNEHQGE